MRFRSVAFLLLTLSWLSEFDLRGSEAANSSPMKVYVLTIRDDIMPPLVYLVRRGVKEAMEARADLLVLDMDTYGGRVDSLLEIIKIIDNLKGETLTYVNHKAF